MTSPLYVIAYDGHDRQVIDYGLGLAKSVGATILVVHVLHWSPYTFLSNEELAARHKVRESELAQARSVVLEPLLKELGGQGVAIDGMVRHGQTADVLIQIAKERGAALILVGRSSSMSRRMFGSVTSALAQEAPVPVVIVP